MRTKPNTAVLIAAILTGFIPQLPAVVVVIDYIYDDGGFFFVIAGPLVILRRKRGTCFSRAV